jgi:TatD DNase family protein
MLIDTHCHLTDRHITDADIPGILERAAAADVGKMIVTGADPEDVPKIIELIDAHDNLFGTLGIHPHHASDAPALDYQHFLSHQKIVALGEIGLDYYYGKLNADAQKELFRAQMEIAHKHGMPVAIHSRDAAHDTAEILCDTNYSKIGGGGAPGVMHCVYTNWDFTKQMLDRGFFISTSGTLTFKKKDEARQIFKKAPLDRIVIETDAPYLAPEPFRGKPCEPAMIVETAKVLADIRGISLLELEKILLENTKKLFPKLIV